MKDFSMPNPIINVTLTWRVPNASNFCAVTLILSPYGIIAILINRDSQLREGANQDFLLHFLKLPDSGLSHQPASLLEQNMWPESRPCS